MKLPIIPSSALTALQARWIGELLEGPIPAETRTTCDDCRMIPQPGETPGPDHFDPRMKCCTYLPMIHNFLAGAILEAEPADEAARRGRLSVEARIDAGRAVTPGGLFATQEYLDAYAADHTFGHAYELRCPHYQAELGGQCGVWRQREATCSTWFCKHVRGSVGWDFWRRGMTPLLRAAEMALSTFCVEELGATATEWGIYEGKPRELYLDAARLVHGVTWKDLEEIGGEEVQALAQATRGYHALLLDETIPERLKLAVVDVEDGGGEVTRLATATPFDPIDVPTRVFRELHRFDGRPRSQVLRELRAVGVSVDDELLRKLFDWRVLMGA